MLHELEMLGHQFIDSSTTISPRKRDPATIVGALGLKWDTANDHLFLPHVPIDTVSQPTLQLILKQSAQIFDPLGILSVITIRAKILMQTIRHASFLWDDQLPVNLQEAWIEIANDLKQISKHRSTRYTPVEEDVEIHAFADASAKAYGTAIYLISNGKITLIFAKTRLTPTRKLSIPKLELLAALITSRAINFIESAFRKTTITRKIMWSDSKCVIAQIKTTKILPTYVENRVTEIRKVPKPSSKTCAICSQPG